MINGVKFHSNKRFKFDPNYIFCMSDGETSKPEERLPLGTKVPNIDTVDVFDNKINLAEDLKNHPGIIIDFHRGAW